MIPRRIFGIEQEYGLACVSDGNRSLNPDEVARYLFRKIVSWGRSSNVFLTNGARLYLDVGSHPEYATGECDSPEQVVLHDKAGERILEGMVEDAQELLRAEGIPGSIYVFKNNTDSAGNSFGCHENYLIPRSIDFQRLSDALIPFLVTRQLFCGSGKILKTPTGPKFCFSQRADHLWEGVSSATTRSRPIINTRDEPHADAEKYRRLHIISGDSNMSETTSLLKIGGTDLILRMIESGVIFQDLMLENPIQAIRDISHDCTGSVKVRLVSGRELTALEIQQEYLGCVLNYFDRNGGADPSHKKILELWQRCITALTTGQLHLIQHDIDWVIKHQLINRFCRKYDLDYSSAKVKQLDLAYHDINRSRGLFYILQNSGFASRIASDLEIFTAKSVPPATTRAKLRGDFVRQAQAAQRDFTVDWVHLKLNDPPQRTILCKDPFLSTDERVADMLHGL